jgi:hypothetical protein
MNGVLYEVSSQTQDTQPTLEDEDNDRAMSGEEDGPRENMGHTTLAQESDDWEEQEWQQSVVNSINEIAQSNREVRRRLSLNTPQEEEQFSPRSSPRFSQRSSQRTLLASSQAQEQFSPSFSQRSYQRTLLASSQAQEQFSPRFSQRSSQPTLLASSQANAERISTDFLSTPEHESRTRVSKQKRTVASKKRTTRTKLRIKSRKKGHRPVKIKTKEKILHPQFPRKVVNGKVCQLKMYVSI